MWLLFEDSFLKDIKHFNQLKEPPSNAFSGYVINEVMNLIVSYFNSPFSDQSTGVQKRQVIFVQLLQSIFKLSQNKFLNSTQRFSVETCIRTLSEIGKKRGIALPSDLEMQLMVMFNKNAVLTRQTSKWLLASKQTKIREGVVNFDMQIDRSIIEGLQDIVSLLEDQLKSLVEAEQSLLIDILYRSELLFPLGTESRKNCESGRFIRRYVHK